MALTDVFLKVVSPMVNMVKSVWFMDGTRSRTGFKATMTETYFKENYMLNGPLKSSKKLRKTKQQSLFLWVSVL